jgi:hypothetical protein
VLEGSSKAIIKTKMEKEGYVLEIIKDDPELDLLIAKTSLKSTTPVPLGNSDTIIVGEDIVVMGNPAGLEGSISKGIISGIRETEGTKIIQITAPISQGSSGGPVFNLSGKVIGIATAYLKIGQNLNFAMPSNYLNSIKSVQIKLGSLPRMKFKERETETEEERWKLYHEKKGGSKGEQWREYYDKGSIIRLGEIVRVWIKTIPVDKEGYRLHMTQWQKEQNIKSKTDYSNYEYGMYLYGFSCEERKWAMQKGISYGTNNEVISTHDFSSTLDWHDILPLSKDEKLYKIVCE